jgi:hypothetical protein
MPFLPQVGHSMGVGLSVVYTGTMLLHEGHRTFDMGSELAGAGAGAAAGAGAGAAAGGGATAGAGAAAGGAAIGGGGAW